RQLYMSGNAVLKAARELRAQILSVAASLLGADPTALDLADGDVVTRDGRTLPLPTVLSQCARVGVPRSHLAVYHAPAGEPVDLATGSGKVFPDYTFGAHAADVPDVDPIVVESGEGLGPFGARGIGEPPIGPPAAAVANAIADATGARVTRLPLTAERVAAALGLLRT